MQKMRAIDLALRVREAFYQLSDRKLEALLGGNSSDDLFDLVWNVAPKIFPLIEPQAVNQLTALAVDMPELMTCEPGNIQDLRFDYDLLPLTPLRVLHANVVDLAICFAKDEIANLPRIKRLSGDCRHVYNMMQKQYVVEGFAASGCVSIEGVQQEVFGRWSWNFAKKARALLAALIAEGFVVQRDCIDEAYELTLSERGALIERYHLATRWPKSSFDEVADVQRALSADEHTSEEKSL